MVGTGVRVFAGWSMTAEAAAEGLRSKATTSEAGPGRAEPSGSLPSGMEVSPATEACSAVSRAAWVGRSWVATRDAGDSVGEPPSAVGASAFGTELLVVLSAVDFTAETVFAGRGLGGPGVAVACPRAGSVAVAGGGSAGVSVEGGRLGAGTDGEGDGGAARSVLGGAAWRVGVGAGTEVRAAGSGAVRSTEERAEETAAPALPGGTFVTWSIRIVTAACKIREQTKDRPIRLSGRCRRPGLRLKGE